MSNNIFYLLIALGFFGLIIIVYRKISVLAKLSEEEIVILSRKKGLADRVKGVNYKQHWLNFIVSLEKLLMRIKIIFLKIENILGGWIVGLRGSSKVMAQKSREWIKQKEIKRREKQNKLNGQKPSDEVVLKINKKIEPDYERTESILNRQEIPKEEETHEEISLDDLNKPIKEEQEWIDLIVENPKNITAYKFLGLFYWKQHNYSDAKASLEMAVKLGSKDKKVKEALEELKKMGVE